MVTLERILSIKSLDDLSTSEFIDFVQLLIAHETKPGGPYVFDVSNEDNISLNDRIYDLLLAKGKKLNPNMRSAAHSKIAPNKKIDTKSLDVIHSIALKNIKTQFDENSFRFIESICSKIRKADSSGEISQLSDIFHGSIRHKYRNKIQFKKNIQLKYSLANIYTWITYTMIDKLLDSEIEPHILPSTYIMQRNIISQYKRSSVSMKLVFDMFDIVDRANALELYARENLAISPDGQTITIKNYNYPALESLMWQKSIAHTIGPLSIVQKIKPESFTQLFKAMQLYCSARQLNDDVHDWQEDLSNGQITYVISKLLEHAEIQPGMYNSIDLLNKLKLIYWEKTLLECASKIQDDIQNAIQILESELLDSDSEFIRLFLKPIFDSAKEAASQNTHEKSFLKQSRLLK